jgi:hypothetical protein
MPSQLDTYSTAGSYSYTIPSWANKIDVIVLGGGAAGTNGTLGNGSGGRAGSWSLVTLTRGVDIPLATTTITGVVGAGGTGNGGAGVASTATGTGMTSLSGAGGSGNMGLVDPNGQGAGTQVYNGQTYVGGAIRNVAVGSAAMRQAAAVRAAACSVTAALGLWAVCGSTRTARSPAFLRCSDRS